MRSALFVLATAAAAGLCACSVCNRDSSADGVYAILTDCTGSGLTRGTIAIGAFNLDATGAASCGTGTTSPSSCSAAEDACAETAAGGASRLGLPPIVRVKSDQVFELFGEAKGLLLDCGQELFGDERLLLCRSGGLIVCTAIVNPGGG